MIDLIKWIQKKNDNPKVKSRINNLTIYKVAQTSAWVVVVSSFLTGLAYLIQSPLDFRSPAFLGMKLGIGMPAVRGWGAIMLLLALACGLDFLIFKRNYWLISLLGGVRIALGLSSLLGSILFGSQHVGYTSSIASITIGSWLIIIGAALIIGKPNGVDYTRRPSTPEEIVDLTEKRYP